ncbi:ABC transporter ATP-binding protein [Paenibacillus alginolyticus]|uniref:ABC transporter transmembrane domain-containing protein n=1 Tax=Paenibacillus alginolyticus TaxID=59839 RepID=A0ABT4GCK4_9BACL|nr:ABC transporter transmembrane domain-containing protein [Paenibacillus alginolyticus]MCY9693928.1 ABC transporter transmembrane domain-containing protein [Paenibacillus alginolyticus]MEC0146849.1 ABC transporter transmembrane domain-containing protein [Paenibacillus alginolyticus]
MSFVIKLRWFFKERWKYYVLAISLMICVNLLATIPPKMIGNTIDQIRSGNLTASSLSQTVLLLVGLSLLLYVFTYVWITTLFGNSALVEKVLRGRLLAHLTKMTPAFFQRNSTGQLMALATNDVLAIGQTSGYGVMTLVHTLVGASVVIITMISLISFKLMIAALIPLPFLALVISKLGQKVRIRFLAAQASFGQMNDHALESISGIRVIRSYVQEDHDLVAFDKVTSEVMNKNKRVSMLNALFQPLTSLIVGLSYSIGIGYGSYMVFHDEITLGQLISFNIYLGMLIWPMISFGEFINVLQRGSASADRLDTALTQKADIVDVDAPIAVSVPERIEMQGLTFTYPTANHPSLVNVSFQLKRGQTLGIVGRTGSGKSTLLKQLLRQFPIEPGKLLVSGVPIERIALDQVKRWVAYVPQEHLLLSKSIRDNVALGKHDASPEEIARAIEMASFTQDIEQMPEGLVTIVGENGVMLSGGQKQRLAIARALLIDSEILLLDDSLSAVDARTESRILQHIRKERAGRTTLISTHRLSAVSHANWILVLDEGRIVEEGTHEELMLFGGWYREQWERQQMEASLEE